MAGRKRHHRSTRHGQPRHNSSSASVPQSSHSVQPESSHPSVAEQEDFGFDFARPGGGNVTHSRNQPMTWANGDGASHETIHYTTTIPSAGQYSTAQYPTDSSAGIDRDISLYGTSTKRTHLPYPQEQLGNDLTSGEVSSYGDDHSQLFNNPENEYGATLGGSSQPAAPYYEPSFASPHSQPSEPIDDDMATTLGPQGIYPNGGGAPAGAYSVPAPEGARYRANSLHYWVGNATASMGLINSSAGSYLDGQPDEGNSPQSSLEVTMGSDVGPDEHDEMPREATSRPYGGKQHGSR